jgi:hypothetical protein
VEIPILAAPRRFVCPNCPAWYVEPNPSAPQRFHPCPGLKGILAPGVLEGSDCKVEAVVREDYVGIDAPHLDDDGRPIMAVRTERADGSNDIAVMAPCAVMVINQ